MTTFSAITGGNGNSPPAVATDMRHPAGCGTHHETAPGVCCCGGDWPGSMTCHPCRNPGHGAAECVDGPPPVGEGGRVLPYPAGRYCGCQHKKHTTKPLERHHDR